MLKRTNTMEIRTADGIRFSILLAGPVSRMLALLVDLLCISVFTSITGSVLRLFSLISPDITVALVIISNFLISMGYGIVFEWIWRGQTPGKRLLRLRVIDEQGLKLQFGQVVIRNLLRVVDSLPLLYLAGGASSLITQKCQRLGDLAAGTIVVRTQSITLPQVDHLGEEKFNSLREYPHLVARLRQKVSPEEGAIALRALLRRDELESSARLELFRELANLFRSRVRFPGDKVDGVADEKYVRNVVEVLFSQQRV